MADSPRRVALTGATGFVGRVVLDELLKQGYRVSALARREQQFRDGVTWITGSLTDDLALKALVTDADAVVHVAGQIKARRRADFFDINKGGTARLIAALEGRPVRFVHLSSLAAREPALSGYAASKSAAEVLVKSAPGLDWTILRPPAVYGPGDRETLVFFKAARQRRPLLPGTRRHRTSLIHVADLAEAIVGTIDLPALTGKVAETHDGAEDGYTFAEVLDMIHGGPGFHHPIFVPGRMLEAAGGVIWLASAASGGTPMLTPGKARELTHMDWVCRDTTLAEAGWRASIPASRGLTETRAWYEKNGDLR
ncbi:MAG: NAD-dependent epimerase/dehydratase family protein [Sphingomonadales bacterium]